MSFSFDQVISRQRNASHEAQRIHERKLSSKIMGNDVANSAAVTIMPVRCKLRSIFRREIANKLLPTETNREHFCRRENDLQTRGHPGGEEILTARRGRGDFARGADRLHALN